MTKLQLALHALLNTECVREYRFHPTRRFRFDYALPEYKIAIEIEGGVWIKGRHTRGAGYQRDLIKYNLATTLGWRVLRYTPDTPIGVIVAQVKEIIGDKNE